MSLSLLFMWLNLPQNSVANQFLCNFFHVINNSNLGEMSFPRLECP